MYIMSLSLIKWGGIFFQKKKKKEEKKKPRKNLSPRFTFH